MRLLLVASIVLLTACQGQNPFKRESNPVKKYPHTMEAATQPYVPGQKTVKPGTAGLDAQGRPLAPAKPPCFEPLIVEAEPDLGNSLLKFVDEVESSYDIKVTIGGTYTIDDLKADTPEDSSFRQISRQDNTYTLRLTWKPEKGTSAKKSDPFVIGFLGEKIPEGACEQAKIRTSFDIVVSKTNDVPSVTFQDIKEKIVFGEKFDFKIIVQDPTAVKGKAPALKPIKFGEKRGSSVLDASAAVTGCDEGQALSQTKFEFVCHFDSNLVKGVEKLLSTGKEALASFQVTASSTQTGVNGVPTPQKIKVLFEKIETKPAAPVQGAKK